MKKIKDIIEVLSYKENKELFISIYQKKDVFENPLLFAYFNNKKFSYFDSKLFNSVFLDDTVYSNIDSTSIKLLNIKHQVLNGTFKSKETPINFEKIEISKKLNAIFIKKLTNAITYIKSYVPEHFALIEKHCKVICLFDTSPTNTNSFATINAHGMVFFNVYQKKEYDEVFFVDDISHQTGHVIMNSFWFDRKKHFIINENDNIKNILDKPNEYRNFYILFHALYTYYTTVLCLENCIDTNCFNDEQKMEAKARIVFYLKKYAYDLVNFEKVCHFYGGIDNVIHKESQILFKKIMNKYLLSKKRWENELQTFNFKNQPYNFTLEVSI
jgi:hypothetical protein